MNVLTATFIGVLISLLSSDINAYNCEHERSYRSLFPFSAFPKNSIRSKTEEAEDPSNLGIFLRKIDDPSASDFEDFSNVSPNMGLDAWQSIFDKKVSLKSMYMSVVNFLKSWVPNWILRPLQSIKSQWLLLQASVQK